MLLPGSFFYFCYHRLFLLLTARMAVLRRFSTRRPVCDVLWISETKTI